MYHQIACGVYLKSDTSLSLEEIQNALLALAQGDENTIICMEMLLHALQVAPRGQGRVSKQEQHDLNHITPSSSDTDDLHFRVMVLCYGKLSNDYKSCLQYLSAFLHEKSIRGQAWREKHQQYLSTECLGSRRMQRPEEAPPEEHLQLQDHTDA